MKKYFLSKTVQKFPFDKKFWEFQAGNQMKQDFSGTRALNFGFLSRSWTDNALFWNTDRKTGFYSSAVLLGLSGFRFIYLFEYLSWNIFLVIGWNRPTGNTVSFASWNSRIISTRSFGWMEITKGFYGSSKTSGTLCVKPAAFDTCSTCHEKFLKIITFASWRLSAPPLICLTLKIFVSN